jgi:hypothetical protein
LFLNVRTPCHRKEVCNCHSEWTWMSLTDAYDFCWSCCGQLYVMM